MLGLHAFVKKPWGILPHAFPLILRFARLGRAGMSMRFTQFICKNVLRRKVRSTLTGIGVAIAISAVVALLGVANGFEESSREMLTGRGVDLIVQRVGSGDFDTARLDQSIGDQIAQLPEVGDVAPLLEETEKLNNDPLGVPLEGLPPGSFALKDFERRIIPGQGRGLEPTDQNCVMLGTILARNLEKKPGDTVVIGLKNFKVVGIFQGSSLLENRYSRGASGGIATTYGPSGPSVRVRDRA